METYLPYLYGALLGLGAVLAYYGLKRVRDARLGDGDRRAGLWMINIAIVLVAASMALMLWAN